jgi:hypothetical protein
MIVELACPLCSGSSRPPRWAELTLAAAKRRLGLPTAGCAKAPQARYCAAVRHRAAQAQAANGANATHLCEGMRAIVEGALTVRLVRFAYPGTEILHRPIFAALGEGHQMEPVALQGRFGQANQGTAGQLVLEEHVAADATP